MVIIRLDIEKMMDKTTVHYYLRDSLGFPEYYGMNLDALYDCLTEIGSDVTIVMPCEPRIQEAMGDYGLRLLSVFSDAAKYNRHLNILFQ